eukprot:4170767-Pyramimonas_sp.AAC.1
MGQPRSDNQNFLSGACFASCPLPHANSPAVMDVACSSAWAPWEAIVSHPCMRFLERGGCGVLSELSKNEEVRRPL